MNGKRFTIAIATVVLSWYAMMALHELGHCLGAMATGGRIESVEMPLLGFSRTVVTGGCWPLLVVWAGPLVGATAPLLFLAMLGFLRRRAERPTNHILQFFAGFCLLANGLYIGAGAFIGAGDCHELMQLGSPAWLLVAFGLSSSTGGLYAWHRMGPLRTWFGTA